MSFTKIPVQLWMMLDRPSRLLLADEFGLKRTGITEVVDDRVVTDGYSNKDLEGITEEAMTHYVGSAESFPRLWELSCAKAHSTLNPPMGTIRIPPEPIRVPVGTLTTTNEPTHEEKRKPGRPRKDA